MSDKASSSGTKSPKKSIPRNEKSVKQSDTELEDRLQLLLSELVEDHKRDLLNHSKSDPILQIEILQGFHADKKLMLTSIFAKRSNAKDLNLQQTYIQKLELLLDENFQAIETAHKLKLQNTFEEEDKNLDQATKDFQTKLKRNVIPKVRTGIELENKCFEEMLVFTFVINFNNSKNPYLNGSPEWFTFSYRLKNKLVNAIAQLGLELDKETIRKVKTTRAATESITICEEFFDNRMRQVENRCKRGYLEENEIFSAYQIISDETMARYLELQYNGSRTSATLWKNGEQDLKQKLETKLIILQDIHSNRKILKMRKARQIERECLELYVTTMHSPKDEDFHGPEDFQKTHKLAKETALQNFQEKLKAKNCCFYLKHQITLEELIQQYKKDFAIMFRNRALQQDDMISQTIAACLPTYHSEMARRFDGLHFVTKINLDDAHQRASQYFLNKCRQQQGEHISPYQNKKLEEKVASLYDYYEKKNTLTLNSKAPAPAIGIDLGTTYSCVAAYYNDKVHVIQYFNSMGQHTIPSYVAFMVNVDGELEYSVGTTAKEEAFLDPENAIYDVKRIIGRKFTDPFVQQNLKSSGWPFEVIDSPDGVPRIGVCGGKRYFAPEEVSAKLLQELKKMAEGHFSLSSNSITNVVITHPASFTDGQKQATKHAAQLAGFTEVTLLNEPTAAAVAYTLQRLTGDSEKVLVFDYGGGTFDTCVIQVGKTNIEVIATEGDPKCGGEDLDKNLMRYCAEEFKKANGGGTEFDILAGMNQDSDAALKLECRRNWGRLQLKCEQAKISLSTAAEHTVFVDRFLNNVNLRVTVSQKKFEELNNANFKKAIGCLEKLMEENDFKIEDIHEIVLVGGSSRIPRVQEMLEDLFMGKALTKYIPPDHAVAYGAAIKAALRFGEQTKGRLQLDKITDIIPRSLGIAVVNNNVHGCFSPIARKHAKIPLKVCEGGYTTVRNNQTSVSIQIYQGESMMVAENELLGMFELGGLVPAPAGTEKIEVCMEVDEDGILNVTAISQTSDQEKSLVVTAFKSRLSNEYIQNILHEESICRKLVAIRQEVIKLGTETTKFEGPCYTNFYVSLKRKYMKEQNALASCQKNVGSNTELQTRIQNTQKLISDGLGSMKSKIHNEGRSCANCDVVA